MYNDLSPVTAEVCSANNIVTLHDKVKLKKLTELLNYLCISYLFLV